ncbi:MAG: glycosyltransferase family 2 protein [Candidatus Kariarchaeaceae archaeon]|jgi:glycosyltransferase involved in cell wall biosynthesis
MREKTLLIVCPAYDEAENIRPLLKNIQEHINQNDEIIVVNDGSTDKTVEQAQLEDIYVISHFKNQGKGMAIRTGIKYFLDSNHDYVIFMDGDGQHEPKDIAKFRYCLHKRKADIVVASRFRTKTWHENMPFSRKISNLLSRFGLWILYNGFVVEDPQNGYRGYNRRLSRSIEFHSNGYEAETEILIDAFLKNFKFDVISIESVYHSHNRSSKFSLLMDTWKIPKVMIKGFFNNRPWLLRHQKK